ncbi:MAG: hypothetical protein J6I53_11485 [Treponema sp.]|nr:hypothetical protein [Treponema sp.]
MKRSVRREDGYTVLLTLALILVLMLALSGTLSLASAWKSRANALERRLSALGEADEILRKLALSMQSLASDESDTFDTDNYNAIISEFADCSLSLSDVSSGVNTKFWCKKITETQAVQSLLLSHDESEYSWLCPTLCNEETLSESLKSSGAKNATELFPLVNFLPLTNIYSLDEETVFALLSSLKTKNAEEKTEKLFEAVKSHTASDKEIAEILSVQMNSQAMAIFGTKTAFWKASLATDSCSVRAVFAAVPNKGEKPREVERYILFERKIEYRGSLNEN